MRCFICTLATPVSSIQLGITAEHTERIIPVTRTQAGKYETENGEAFVSLPALFKQEHSGTPHGVVLKNTGSALKTVLLSPRIDIDLEIPKEAIHPLPDTLTGVFRNFSGACFDKENLILILDTNKLAEGRL